MLCGSSACISPFNAWPSAPSQGGTCGLMFHNQHLEKNSENFSATFSFLRHPSWASTPSSGPCGISCLEQRALSIPEQPAASLETRTQSAWHRGVCQNFPLFKCFKQDLLILQGEAVVVNKQGVFVAPGLQFSFHTAIATASEDGVLNCFFLLPLFNLNQIYKILWTATEAKKNQLWKFCWSNQFKGVTFPGQWIVITSTAEPLKHCVARCSLSESSDPGLQGAGELWVSDVSYSPQVWSPLMAERWSGG